MKGWQPVHLFNRLTLRSIRLRDVIEPMRGRINRDREYLAGASGRYLAAGQGLPNHGRGQLIAIFHLVVLPGLGLAGDGEMRGIDLLDAGDMDGRVHKNREALGRTQAGRPVVRHLNGDGVRAG